MAQLLRLLTEKFYIAEQALDRLIRNVLLQSPHPRLAVAVGDPIPQQHYPTSQPNALEDLTDNGILWAVQKSRRSREKRHMRKFGSQNGHKKMLPLLKLLTCVDCGHVHEPGRLCPNCYSKNKEVTEVMQTAMNSFHGLNPIEHEVLPVFQGEKVEAENGFFQGKRIVEVPRERPKWFSRRLTLKSNVTTSTASTIAKPTNLA
ncbi:large ribosomal subunit protein bL32m isoform X1 [Panulirus ornatus]|uniref:large ribosomal subunit protein bL32m isoform X1 n=1 Tax=Panulirus ornatus TaxID=150431 RepID=UPI003A8C1F22